MFDSMLFLHQAVAIVVLGALLYLLGVAVVLGVRLYLAMKGK